jgi:HD-like signal output (HDOD) protein
VVDRVDDGRAIDVIEQAEFGVDHAQVGGWLAEAWRMPAVIVGAIRDHHQPLLDTAGWSPERVVVIADQLVHGTDMATGELRPGALAVIDRTAAQGLSGADWAEMIAPLRAEADLLGELFKG